MARKASKIEEVDISDASSATAYPMPSNRVADWISSILAPESCLMGQPSISNIGAGSVARWNPARLLSFGQQTGNAAGGSDFAQSPLAVAYSSAEKMEPAQGNGPVGIIAERAKN